MNNMKTFKFPYTNWKGVTRIREIIPCKVEFQEYNKFHGKDKWILKGVDVEKPDEFRDFNMDDIIKGAIIRTMDFNCQEVPDEGIDFIVESIMNDFE